MKCIKGQQHLHSRAKDLLTRPFLLPSPASQIQFVATQAHEKFVLVRDDNLHPLIGGNKIRKLDAVFPNFLQQGVTDIVTCGGLQSAHTAAVAVNCAMVGIGAHSLVRGERPKISTGYHLITRMFGSVIYISRAEYADRATMLAKYSKIIEDEQAGRKVALIEEGAGQPGALLGLVREVAWLAEALPSGSHTLVVDSGTGTTAVGLAVGIALLGLAWNVVGVMLAGDEEYYSGQATKLAKEFTATYLTDWPGMDNLAQKLPLRWCQRAQPRAFGRVLPGEVEECIKVARYHGILLDPIYSLAAWEVSKSLARTTGRQSSPLTSALDEESTLSTGKDPSASSVFETRDDGSISYDHASAFGGMLSMDSIKERKGTSLLSCLPMAHATWQPKKGENLVVMIHCGGAMGLNGLAQRMPEQF